MDNRLKLMYVLDRYKGKPISFLFVTNDGDHYIANGDTDFIFLGKTFSDLITIEPPTRQDHLDSFGAEDALRRAIETNDRDKIYIKVSFDELDQRFGGDKNNVKFTL